MLCVHAIHVIDCVRYNFVYVPRGPADMQFHSHYELPTCNPIDTIGRVCRTKANDCVHASTCCRALRTCDSCYSSCVHLIVTHTLVFIMCASRHVCVKIHVIHHVCVTIIATHCNTLQHTATHNIHVIHHVCVTIKCRGHLC